MPSSAVGVVCSYRKEVWLFGQSMSEDPLEKQRNSGPRKLLCTQADKLCYHGQGAEYIKKWVKVFRGVSAERLRLLMSGATPLTPTRFLGWHHAEDTLRLSPPNDMRAACSHSRNGPDGPGFQSQGATALGRRLRCRSSAVPPLLACSKLDARRSSCVADSIGAVIRLRRPSSATPQRLGEETEHSSI